MKILIVNSKIKQKSKAILGLIRNLILDFPSRNISVTRLKSQKYLQKI